MLCKKLPLVPPKDLEETVESAKVWLLIASIRLISRRIARA